MIIASFISLYDDIQWLVQEINQSFWDDANDMARYEVAALKSYLMRQDTLFVACHDHVRSGRTLLGIASARLQCKPYGSEHWLYVDEVDVCVGHRHRGAGKAMMRKLIEFAVDTGCDEVWLGTETDNHPANALYRSLKPDAVEQVVGYTYETGHRADGS